MTNKNFFSIKRAYDFEEDHKDCSYINGRVIYYIGWDESFDDNKGEILSDENMPDWLINELNKITNDWWEEEESILSFPKEVEQALKSAAKHDYSNPDEDATGPITMVELTGTGYVNYTFTAMVGVPSDIVKNGENAIREYLRKNKDKIDWEDYDPCDEDKNILPTDVDTDLVSIDIDIR